MFELLKKNRQATLGVAVSAVSLYFVLENADLARMGSEIRSANALLLLFAVLPVAFQLIARGYRWKYLLPDNGSVSGWSCVQLTAVGYMLSNFLPGRAGDLYRGLALASSEKIRRTTGLTSVFIEKLLDSVILIVLLALLSVFFEFPGGVSDGIKTFSFSIAAIMALTAMFVVLPISWRKRLFSFLPLPAQINEAVEFSLENFDRTVKQVMRLESLLRQVPLSAVVWFFAIYYYLLVLTAFGIDISLAGVLLLACITSIGMAVPSAPGNLGVFHYLTIIVLALYGIPKDEALGVAVVLHGVSYIVITLMGVFMFFRRSMHLKDLRTSEDV